MAPSARVEAPKEESDEWTPKRAASAAEADLSSLCMGISRPAALFDMYATTAVLDNVTKDKKDDPASRFGMI